MTPEALKLQVDAAHLHNKQQDACVKRYLIDPKQSTFRQGVNLALRGQEEAAKPFLLPFLTADGPLPSAFWKDESRGTAVVSLVKEYIKGKITALRRNSPPQCCFLGSHGGTPGQNLFYPLSGDPLFVVAATTNRPQIVFQSKFLKDVSVDNIFFWNGLQSCISEASSVFAKLSNEHNQMESLGYDSNTPSWKDLYLPGIQDITDQFQFSRGAQYGRLQFQLRYRIRGAKQGSNAWPYVNRLISRNEDDKSLNAEWEDDTWSSLVELISKLETEPAPHCMSSIRLFESYVEEEFEGSNPNMLGIIQSLRKNP